MKERVAPRHTSVHYALMLAGLVAAGLTGSVGRAPASVPDTLAQRTQAGKVAQAVAVAAPAAAAAPAPAPVQIAFAPAPAAAAVSPFHTRMNDYYAKLRSKLHWMPVKLGDAVLQTPDPRSRLLLSESAAKQAGLDKVGLSYKDVYGIINAETSWIPRLGASKDGTPNLGIAQFEPATARAVGLTDPSDPVQAVHAAALQLKDAAIWSAKRIANLKLTPAQYALKLREGVSIYYNLSSKGRSVWNGLNTAKLPVETRRHIANARIGAREAAELEQQLQQVKARVGQPGTMTASFDKGN